MSTSGRARATSRKPLSHDEAAVFVLRKLRLLFNTMKGHFREVEKKAGVAGAQVWALSVIHSRPGAGVNELARAMDVHQSTASNLLKSLVEKGLVVSERSETDARALKLRVTRTGAAVLRKAPAPVRGVLPDVLSKLDLATLQRLDQDLEALIALMDTDRRGEKVPLGQPGA